MWEKMKQYPQVFDDVIPRTFEEFKNGLLAPTNQFYEFVQGEDVIGLAAATQVRPRLDANIHIVMFDRRLRGREEVMKIALQDFARRAQLRRITACLPEDNRTAIKLALRLGFKLEGVMRKAHLRDGVYRDFHIFGVLFEELFDLDSDRPGPRDTGADGPRVRPVVREEHHGVRHPGLPGEDETIPDGAVGDNPVQPRELGADGSDSGPEV